MENDLNTKDIFYNDQENVPELWYLLNNDITPNAIQKEDHKQEPSNWRSILFAGWLHFLTKDQGGNLVGDEDLFQFFKESYATDRKFREMIYESLEMASFHSKFLENKKRLSPAFVRKLSSEDSPLPSREAVSKLLSQTGRDLEQRVFITPLFDPSQIGEGSIDIRLGQDYILFNRTTGVLKINPIEIDEIEKDLHRYQTRIRLGFGEPLYLHSGELILARTLEYISLPQKIAGEVIGRSSWGRLGPIIATAPRIQPGFKGTVTLEIVNLGNIPVVLYPCLRIAQLVLYPIGN